MARKALVGVIAMVLWSVALIGNPGSGADTLTPVPFAAAGEAISVTPGLIGSTGGRFTLDNLYRTGGNIGPAGEPIEVHSKSDTNYYVDPDGDGSYSTSTLTETVVVGGADVWVAGRYTVTAGRYTFIANNVFSPPPQAIAGGPARPDPELPADAMFDRLFSIRAVVSAERVRLEPSCCSHELYGFIVHPVTEANTGKVRAIADANHWHGEGDPHNGLLPVYTKVTTNYWQSGNFLEQRDAVVFKGNEVQINGRYQWDVAGGFWRFAANNVVDIPDGPVEPRGGPFSVDGTLIRANDGQFNDSTQTWDGTVFEGRGYNSRFGGDLVFTLDWWHNDTTGKWEFVGEYSFQRDGTENRIEGIASGEVTTEAIAELADGQLSVDQTYGVWEGWQGFGEIRNGSAEYLGPPSSASPPLSISANFFWKIFETTA